MKRYLKVDFSGPEKSCMLAIQGSFTSHEFNKTINVIKIEKDDKRHYASVLSRTRSDTSLLKINGKFGHLLNLKDGEEILVSAVDHEVPIVKSVYVNCDSEDDFEILESNSETLCNNLLHQLRVVYPGLHFPFWVSKSASINLSIERLEPPVEFGILESTSEIIIPSIVEPDKRHSFVLKFSPTLRVHPLLLCRGMDLLPSSSKLILENIEHAFVYKQSLSDFKISIENQHKDIGQDDSCSSFFAKVIPLLHDSKSTNKEDTQSQNVPLISYPEMKIFFIENLLLTDKSLKSIFPFLNPRNIFVHPRLIDTYSSELKVKSFISIEQISTKTTTTTLLQYAPLEVISARDLSARNYYFPSFTPLFDEARNFLTASLGLTMAFRHGMCGPTFGITVVTGKSGCGKTTFVQSIAQSFTHFPHFLHCESISCAKLRGKKPETIQKEFEAVVKEVIELSPSILILDDLDILCPADNLEQQNLQEEFLNYRTCEIIYEVIKSLGGKQIGIMCTAKGINSLHSYWRSREGFHIFQHCIHIPPPNQLERLGIFRACLRRYQSRTESNTISSQSSSSTMSWNRTIVAPISTPPLPKISVETSKEESDKGQNVSLLNASTTTNICVSGKDENAGVTDFIKDALSNLHDDFSSPNAIHNIAKKWILCLAKENFPSLSEQERKETFQDIIQQEIQSREPKNKKTDMLQKPITWDEIGGISNVKNELTKILMWPIKYSKLFDNSPIRMPCGILLYGYPGTGKTLVGLSMTSVIPNAKFVHIKGPELLSKYIGASEQAVQDLFRKAKESSPCVIFFDEFDSLVPRRGHDSTGVTDRVVNQFLAELDGIEGGLGQGVYLIAATSRPDLIDPAVLRPGRLDKHLFFNLPNAEERSEIIKVLSANVKYSDSDGKILWDEIARHKTEGLTGADLHSLLCTAQLESIQESVGNLLKNSSSSTSSDEIPETMDAENRHEEICVTMKHIEKTLKSFKPSLPREEFNKFKNIYASFSSGKQSNSDPGSFLIERGKKATLA